MTLFSRRVVLDGHSHFEPLMCKVVFIYYDFYVGLRSRSTSQEGRGGCVIERVSSLTRWKLIVVHCRCLSLTWRFLEGATSVVGLCCLLFNDWVSAFDLTDLTLVIKDDALYLDRLMFVNWKMLFDRKLHIFEWIWHRWQTAFVPNHIVQVLCGTWDGRSGVTRNDQDLVPTRVFATARQRMVTRTAVACCQWNPMDNLLWRFFIRHFIIVDLLEAHLWICNCLRMALQGEVRWLFQAWITQLLMLNRVSLSHGLVFII